MEKRITMGVQPERGAERPETKIEQEREESGRRLVHISSSIT
jgi:hypothetical protein